MKRAFIGRIRVGDFDADQIMIAAVNGGDALSSAERRFEKFSRDFYGDVLDRFKRHGPASLLQHGFRFVPDFRIPHAVEVIVTGHRDPFHKVRNRSSIFADSVPQDTTFYVAVIEQELNMITNTSNDVLQRTARSGALSSSRRSAVPSARYCPVKLVPTPFAPGPDIPV